MPTPPEPATVVMPPLPDKTPVKFNTSLVALWLIVIVLPNVVASPQQFEALGVSVNAFVTVTELPLRFQPPVVNVIVFRLFSPLMSLVLFCCVEPEKVKASPLTGAVPPQLAAVLQLLFAPPPVQVLVVCAL